MTLTRPNYAIRSIFGADAVVNVSLTLFGLEMQQRSGLEEIHYGKWEDKTVDFVKQRHWDDYVRWLTEPVWNPPTGGETSVEVASRASLVIAEIQQKYSTGSMNEDLRSRPGT